MSHYLPSNGIYEKELCSEKNCPAYLKGYFSGNSGNLWPIVVLTLVTFLVFAEVRSQDCQTNHCNHNSQELETDDSEMEMIDKINYNIGRGHTIVGWRRAMLAAIFISIFVLIYFCGPRIPHGIVYFIVAVFVFLVIYFVTAWFQASWFVHNDKKIEKSLQELRDKISDIHT